MQRSGRKDLCQGALHEVQSGQDVGRVRGGCGGLQGLDAAGLCGLEGVRTLSCRGGEIWKAFSGGRTCQLCFLQRSSGYCAEEDRQGDWFGGC